MMTPDANTPDPRGLHVALLVSPERWRGERELMRRLAVALVGEGAAVSLIEPAPERDPESTQPVRSRSERRFELPRRISYEARVPFWRRSDRLSRITSTFERAMPDLVWAAGADAWDLATEVGEMCDRPVALDFRRDVDLTAAAKSLRSDRVVAVVAPCDALARLARTTMRESFVHVLPMGVRVDESTVMRVGPAQVIAILGEGTDERPFAAALRAAQAAIERHPDLLFLVEFPESTASSLWRFARALGILDRITAIDPSASGGQLSMTAVSACDVLMAPEPRGGPRPELLAALGRGVPVIAASDPMADAMIDGETAVLLPAGEQSASAWSEALLATLDHPEHARQLAARGRALVMARHRSSIAATAFLRIATDLVRGGPLRFAGRTPQTG